MTDSERAFLDVVVKAVGWGVECSSVIFPDGAMLVVHFRDRTQAADALQRCTDFLKNRSDEMTERCVPPNWDKKAGWHWIKTKYMSSPLPCFLDGTGNWRMTELGWQSLEAAYRDGWRYVASIAPPPEEVP